MTLWNASGRGWNSFAVAMTTQLMVVSVSAQDAPETDFGNGDEAGEATLGEVAPTEPMMTDRPGNGNAASTVSPYLLQIEGSVNFLTDGPSNVQQLSAPTLGPFWAVFLDGTPRGERPRRYPFAAAR